MVYVYDYVLSGFRIAIMWLLTLASSIPRVQYLLGINFASTSG